MNSGISSGKTGTVRSHPGGALVSIAAAAGIVAGAYLLRGSLRQYEQLGYLGIFLISLIGNATIVIPLPAPLIAFVGGSLYQALPAGLTAAAGAALGETTGYLAGRGGRVMAGSSDRFRRLEKLMAQRGFIVLFILSAIPNPLFDLAGIAAGSVGMPFRKFLWATFLGKSVKFVTLAYLGSLVYVPTN